MRTLFSILILVVIALFVRSFIVQAYKIPATSMLPTLMVGDRILVNKNPFTRHAVRRGDIIVFRFPEDKSKDFVKRVIGLPGETIRISDGVVSIDGQPLDEDYAFTDLSVAHKKVLEFASYVVPENNLFVLGDNRSHSYDSRFWGPVPIADVKGKVWRIYWSFDQKNNRTRRERVWAPVH